MNKYNKTIPSRAARLIPSYNWPLDVKPPSKEKRRRLAFKIFGYSWKYFNGQFPKSANEQAIQNVLHIPI